MGKAVRIGDLILSGVQDGYAIFHAYDPKKTTKFRIVEKVLTLDEVKGLGINPEYGLTTPAALCLNLTHGEDYWCLMLEQAATRAPVRNLGVVDDDTVSKIYYHKTKEGSPFPSLTYDAIRRVRKAREEREFRIRMMDHIEDTKAIRNILGQMLVELRKQNEKTAPTKRTPRKNTRRKTDVTD